jgi:glycosyltransferase involved in cell wall biosynthesis
VVEALAEMFPQADIFALLVDPALCKATFDSRRVKTSFLQRLPGITHYYRRLLPLFPYALEQFELEDYDLVISSESGPAKGVITSPQTCHICYCHSPMRYLWDFYHRYRSGMGLGPVSRAFFSLSAHYVRMWDMASASRVDYFVANSQNVARRIRKHYRRDSTVIYPPVEVSAGAISEARDDYYLVVSQFVDYKRVDLAIEACNRLRRPLKIVGEGQEYKRLRRLAGTTVEFLGSLPDPDVRKCYAGCRALLFPGEEDFGMVPVEAQSFGRPVIAYGRGGALETVLCNYSGEQFDPQSSTGVFFAEQSVDSLVRAIQLYESFEGGFSPAFIRHHAERFDARCFKSAVSSFIQHKLVEFRAAGGVTPI